MAPRRKRNIVEGSDSEEEQTHDRRKNSLKNYLFPSPNANKILPTTGTADNLGVATPLASPSPVRKTANIANGSPIAARLKNSRLSKSPCTSPDKRRKGAKGLGDEKGKSGDLIALFSRQAEKAQNSPKPAKTKTVDFVLDDIVSDPISDDGEIGESSTVTSSYVGSRAQKRRDTANPPSSALPAASNSNANNHNPFHSMPPSASQQKFRMPPRPISKAAAVPSADNDLRPWSERFAPVNLDELAVHKKKVADVRRWLDDVLRGRLRQRLLVLKGAAGTGKTATLRLLAKDMDLDILEWRNPTGLRGGTALGFSSAAAQFDEFLNRGSRFTQLDFEGDESGEDSARPNGALGPADGSRQRRKIVLIEEFPNTFMRSSSNLTGFRNTVLHFLAANTPSLGSFAQWQASAENISPVVMVVSETLLTTTSASADSFTAHRLLGPEILRHPGTGLIEFNAIAPTLLAKALEIVVQKEARKSGRRRTPGPQVLRRLGEVGDVRSAVSSLEFLCLKGDDSGDWGAKVCFAKGRRGPKDVALTKGEQETLGMVSQREASLGVFHAVGKVVYNKRDELPFPAGSDEARAEMLPPYQTQYARPKRSLVAVDSLIDETGTDTPTFISALHENYALSCEQSGPSDQHSSLDYINDCIDYLSESDLLCPAWDIFFGGRGTNHFGRDAGSHVLRQDEMAFHVAVRGLLFSLPSPVRRSTARGGPGGGGDQFKMFYPTSLKLWRSREEVEGMVDLWALKFLRGELSGPSSAAQSTAKPTNRALAFLQPKQGDDAKGAPSQPSQRESPKTARTGDEDEEGGAPPLSLGSSARKEMILERMPYMALIARGKKSSSRSLGMRDLEKIVSFHGIGAPATSVDDADDAAEDATPGGTGADAWATDKPTDEPSPRRRRRPAAMNVKNRTAQRPAEETETAILGVGLPICKLYLSDDDIEED